MVPRDLSDSIPNFVFRIHAVNAFVHEATGLFLVYCSRFSLLAPSLRCCLAFSLWVALLVE